MSLKSLIVGATLATGMLSSTHAALLGAQGEATYLVDQFGPNPAIVFFGPQSFTVGAGVEIGPVDFGNLTWTVDISDTSVSFTMDDPYCCTNSAEFNGWVLNFLGGVNLADVAIATTNIDGFDPARVTFTDTSILVNLENLDLRDVRSLSLNIAAVPEPATLALFGIGALGIVAIRRRKTKRLKIDCDLYGGSELPAA